MYMLRAAASVQSVEVVSCGVGIYTYLPNCVINGFVTGSLWKVLSAHVKPI